MKKVEKDLEAREKISFLSGNTAIACSLLSLPLKRDTVLHLLYTTTSECQMYFCG